MLDSLIHVVSFSSKLGNMSDNFWDSLSKFQVVFWRFLKYVALAVGSSHLLKVFVREPLTFYSMMCFPPNPTDSQDSPWLFWYRKRHMDPYGKLKISPKWQRIYTSQKTNILKPTIGGLGRYGSMFLLFQGSIFTVPAVSFLEVYHLNHDISRLWETQPLDVQSFGWGWFFSMMGTKKQTKSTA